MVRPVFCAVPRSEQLRRPGAWPAQSPPSWGGVHLIASLKRHLLRGRKVMTNLDSIFKSRDITLPTKVQLVKAMIFPVLMYGCESWTVKKAER